jgi:predicted ATPase
MFGEANKVPKKVQPSPKPESVLKCTGVQGLYLWGGCGTGKTFVMDMFHDSLRIKEKKRVHFNEWMIDVHERLHRLQKANAAVQDKANAVWTADAVKKQREQLAAGKGKEANADDLIAQVAQEMLNEAWLLCFDEFQVTHISDAIIMKRLFTVLFECGTIVVATSNRPPEDLYLNGLNRPLFLPFIPMLREFCKVHDIASETDYRMITEGDEEDRRVYIFPNDTNEQRLLERKFYRICSGSGKSQVQSGIQLETQGRRILVPKAASATRVAWFKFHDLCDKALGAADYLCIASAFHTVFIADIPAMTLMERDWVRRFITLIDVFYEKHTKLVCTASKDPYTLFSWTEADEKAGVMDEIFAWDRTVSRLVEMQSIKYLSQVSRNLEAEDFISQFDLVSLSDEDLLELWRRYDSDDSGGMDLPEFRFMMEDLQEVKVGHRHLSDEVFMSMLSKCDSDNDGNITFDEFQKYMRTFNTIKSFKE